MNKAELELYLHIYLKGLYAANFFRNNYNFRCTDITCGEAIAILNIYRLSNPVRSILKEGKSKESELTYEEKSFLLRDLELQKRLADREEQKIATGEIIGSISECRSRKYLLQTLITKIKAAPLFYYRVRGQEIVS